MKKAIIYARVSTPQQDVAMQLELGKRKARELGFTDDQLIIIVDNGVSARKVGLGNRKGLNQLLHLIQEGNVEIVLLYDRDRLARSLPEYMEIFKHFIKFCTQVEFTGRNVIPFSNRMGQEAQLALNAQMEGDRIAQRTQDARKYYPNFVYGFERLGKGSEAHYVRKPSEFPELESLFREFRDIQNGHDYETFKSTWKKRIGRDSTVLLQNPFYAGVLINADGTQEMLRHVEALVDVSTIQLNKERFRKWEINMDNSSEVDDMQANLLRNAEIPVICDQCGQTLSTRRRLGKEYYRCSHKSGNPVRVEVGEVESAIKTTVADLIQQINLPDLKEITRKEISDLSDQQTKAISRLRSEQSTLSHKIATSLNGIGQSKHVERFKAVNQELIQSTALLANLKQMRMEVDEMVERVNRALQLGAIEEPITLASQLIHSVRVSHEAIIVTHYFADFMQGVSAS